MTRKRYYDPGDQTTIDLPLPPWYWYVFLQHPKRWIYLVTTWALLGLWYAGWLPSSLHTPLLIAIWAYIPYQVDDIIYQQRMYKVRQKRRAQRLEAMRIRFDRQNREWEPLFQRHIELYREAAAHGYGPEWIKERRAEL